MRLSDRIISKTKLNAQSILRTDANAATLFAGVAYSLTRELAMNFSVVVGITKDAPDFQLEMRLPLPAPVSRTEPREVRLLARLPVGGEYRRQEGPGDRDGLLSRWRRAGSP